MSTIEESFNAYFSNWYIKLPQSAVAERERGKIVKAGWTIWYLTDSDDYGEHLDFYASHRMTNDRHVRLRPSGEQEGLETIAEFYNVSEDPEESERARKAFFERNRAVAKRLEEKGFGFDGRETASARVNRYLLTTPEEERLN